VIVEDEVDLRELQRELLEEIGFRTCAFASLPSRSELVRLGPDVVVLDLVFSGRAAGLAWLQGLVGDHASASIPVVVCTADVDLARREAALLGVLARSVLLKPFDLEEFFTAVRGATKPNSCIPACSKSSTSPAAAKRLAP
jgi:CheY-like chemotaxis protein